MFEKFKKYFPSTVAGAKQSVQNIQSSTPVHSIKKPDTEKPFVDSSFNIKNISSYLKKKFPSTTASIKKGIIPGREPSPLGILPFVRGSEKFVKQWKRRKERDCHPGWRTFDFFPELFYIAPISYKVVGASPNFPEISGHTSYDLKVGFSIIDSIKGRSLMSGISIGLDKKEMPGLYKSGGFVPWSHKMHGHLMGAEDISLIKLKQNRMAYWKKEMEGKTSEGRSRARWNYYNIKHRALKNYYQISPEDGQELTDEWNRFKNSKGMYKKNTLWYQLTGPQEIRR